MISILKKKQMMKFSQIKYNSDSLFSNLEISYNLRINQNNHEIFKYFVLQNKFNNYLIKLK